MANKIPVKYGPLDAYNCSVPGTMGASEVVKAASGRFVKTDGSGRLEIAGDGHSDLAGWAELGEQTCSATEGATPCTLIRDTNCRFRLPLAYDGATYTVNYSAAVLWEAFDLVVVSNVQYVNLTTTSEKTVYVVGGKAATSATANDGYIDVLLSPSKMIG